MNVVGDDLHAVGEFLMMGHDAVGDRVAVVFGPAVVDDEVFIARVLQTVVDKGVRALADQRFVNVLAKSVPGVPAHGRSLCQHNMSLR